MLYRTQGLHADRGCAGISCPAQGSEGEPGGMCLSPTCKALQCVADCTAFCTISRSASTVLLR